MYVDYNKEYVAEFIGDKAHGIKLRSYMHVHFACNMIRTSRVKLINLSTLP